MGLSEELAEVHEGLEHQDKVFLMVLNSCSRKEKKMTSPSLADDLVTKCANSSQEADVHMAQPLPSPHQPQGLPGLRTKGLGQL